MAKNLTSKLPNGHGMKTGCPQKLRAKTAHVNTLELLAEGCLLKLLNPPLTLLNRMLYSACRMTPGWSAEVQARAH